jgi:excinuclease ABC subunit C
MKSQPARPPMSGAGGDLSISHLPDSPGVYYFLNEKEEILYVGKATSLKDRVKSYFAKDLVDTRGERMVEMVRMATRVDFKVTDSVLEALILEASEIHKLQPPYNAMGKDDKSFNYVTITKEDFPKVTITRGSGTYGPFPHAGELKAALKIIRKIFPFRDEKCKFPPAGGVPKPCFNAQIGLCPGPCAGWISKREYGVQIRRIKMFFEAKKEKLLHSIERDMHKAARAQNFEEATKLKHTLYALEHIQDIALIKRDLEKSQNRDNFRVEAYDVAHLSGRETVGVMTVVEDGEVAKDQYRKFKIKLDKNDDVGNLKEVLERRLHHPEWRLPNLIVVDGGLAQMNAAEKVLQDRGVKIEVVSVLKDEHHKAKKVLGKSLLIKDWAHSILLANSEAHRFAISYHRKLRTKGFRL